ncbi:hypothetical protein P7K49_037268 [Saguinus oedipus]|nr:hypothetical protein P7K49_037268 [Saguinus oedipus]
MGARPLSRCPFSGSPRRGGGLRGLQRPPPTPRKVQCLRSPGGSSALDSEPDGFRNRVAAASALSRPHLCRLALGSPAAPRSRPGKPTLAGTEESPSPPPAVAGRLDTGEEQVRPCSWFSLARPPRRQGQAGTHRMRGVGEAGVRGCRDAGANLYADDLQRTQVAIWPCHVCANRGVHTVQRCRTQINRVYTAFRKDLKSEEWAVQTPEQEPSGASDRGVKLEPSGNMSEFWHKLGCCVVEKPQPKKKRRRIDRTMIGEPMNFVHLTHIGSGEMGAGDGLAMTGAVQEQMRSKGNRDRPWSNSRGL